MQEIAVLGAGAWGTALSIQLAKNGTAVFLWEHDPNLADLINSSRENKKYLPQIMLPTNILVTNNLAQVLSSNRDLIIVVPSMAFSGVIKAIKPFITSTTGICIATKGLVKESGDFLHYETAKVLGFSPKLAILSGPSFAKEVALNVPTKVALASNDFIFTQKLSHMLVSDTFAVVITDDLIGVQLGGVMKNVLAIACGIVDGLELGANTRCALLTVALQEMLLLGNALGAKQETLIGLAGVGDLVLTCTDNQSRNRRFGIYVGQGNNIQMALSLVGGVVEGVANAYEIIKLTKQKNIILPICQSVYNIIYNNASPNQVVSAILQR